MSSTPFIRNERFFGNYTNYARIDATNSKTYKTISSQTGSSFDTSANVITTSGPMCQIYSRQKCPNTTIDPVIIRFTASFSGTDGTAMMGFGDFEDGLFIGIDDATASTMFVKTYTDGVLFKTKLTLTNATAGSAPVVIGGVSKTLTLPNVGIAGAINLMANTYTPNYIIQAVDSQMIFISPNSFSSDGTYSVASTLTGSFAAITAGTNATINTYTFDKPSGMDVTAMNTYEILMNGSNVVVSIFNPDALEFMQVYNNINISVPKGAKNFMAYSTDPCSLSLRTAEMYSTGTFFQEYAGTMVVNYITGNTAGTITRIIGQIVPNILTNTRLNGRVLKINSMSGVSSVGVGRISVSTDPALSANLTYTSIITDPVYVYTWSSATAQNCVFSSSRNRMIVCPFVTGVASVVENDPIDFYVDGSDIIYIVMDTDAATIPRIRINVSYSVES